MAQGSRPDRVGEQIREEISSLLLREVRDPGIGLITLTRVKVSPDLQLVRVYYTLMGDAKAREATRRALERATPFLRRQIGSRIRLRRVPELRFQFDESVEHQERIERILLDLQAERDERAPDEQGPGPTAQGPGEAGPGPKAQGQGDSPNPGPDDSGPAALGPGPEKDRRS
jgi:ribosome-binding factor A